MARGKSRMGASRMASAADIDQKPPSAMPSSTRAASSWKSPVAEAAIRLDSTSNKVRVHRTSRRSMFFVRIAMVGAAMAPTIAVAVTACPAAPSEMPRSVAIGVSRLAGRNSAVTRPNTPSESDTIASHNGSLRSSAGEAGAAASDTAGRSGSMADAVSDMLASPGDDGRKMDVTRWSFHARNTEMLDHSSKPEAGDPLTDMLRGLRLDGVDYGRCLLPEPWAVSFP